MSGDYMPLLEDSAACNTRATYRRPVYFTPHARRHADIFAFSFRWLGGILYFYADSIPRFLAIYRRARALVKLSREIFPVTSDAVLVCQETRRARSLVISSCLMRDIGR